MAVSDLVVKAPDLKLQRAWKDLTGLCQWRIGSLADKGACCSVGGSHDSVVWSSQGKRID